MASFLITFTLKKVGLLDTCCSAPIFQEGVDQNAKTAIFEGKTINIPESVLADNTESNKKVLGTESGDKWIEVSLSEQKVRAWEGNTLYLESPVSTGLPYFPTPTGTFTIWAKVRATKMEGGEGKYYYYLPNVPYVMFFENDKVPGYRGYSLHGTYWHNDFGHVHSHGCVNLPTPIAEKLYYWANPPLAENKNFVRASGNNPGTTIIIHD